jgi:hypothetical protein
MTKDHFEHQKRATESKTSEGAGNIAVDDMGIPILEEIVTQKPPVRAKREDRIPKPTAAADTPSNDKATPENEIPFDELREQLKLQANKDIDKIAEKVAIKVVTSMTSDMKQQIQAKLKEILQNNLDEIISKTISDIPKSK